MRYLIITAMVLVLSISALGQEVNLGLDRCNVLNNAADTTAPSKISLHFTIPDSIMGKEIIYAAIEGNLSVHHEGLDSLVELYFYSLLSDWSNGQYDYASIEAITDSLGAGNYTIRLGDSSAFTIDVADFVRDVADSMRVNYGLIGTVDLLGNDNLILPEEMANTMRDVARVRVIYK